MKFPGTIPVLAICNHPRSGKPFVETNGGILEDGSDFRGELPFRMLGTALPARVLLLVLYLCAPASRTDDAIGPAPGDHVRYAILEIGEVNDCFLKGPGFICAGHD
jgi:hypothetical protein